MLSENRLFHYIGVLTISNEENLNVTLPKDDVVNWLFIKIGEHRYGFVYQITSPQEAQYQVPFEIRMSFLMPDKIIELVKCGEEYKVYRGEKIVGTVKFLSLL